MPTLVFPCATFLVAFLGFAPPASRQRTGRDSSCDVTGLQLSRFATTELWNDPSSAQKKLVQLEQRYPHIDPHDGSWMPFAKNPTTGQVRNFVPHLMVYVRRAFKPRNTADGIRTSIVVRTHARPAMGWCKHDPVLNPLNVTRLGPHSSIRTRQRTEPSLLKRLHGRIRTGFALSWLSRERPQTGLGCARVFQLLHRNIPQRHTRTTITTQ